jgi:SMC interacting uncharacterized protein involved in chromosome segregation
LKSLGLLKAAGVVTGIVTLSVAWNGSKTIQTAIDAINEMDEKVMSADSNVKLLKADIKEKYGQLEILKLEIDELNYEIGLYGETESLAKELEEKTKEFENLKNEYDKLFEELGTYDYEDLIKELELAEYDAERLREAMEGSSIENTKVNSTSEIDTFINTDYTPIKFTSHRGTDGKYHDDFRDNKAIIEMTKNIITEYLESKDIYGNYIEEIVINNCFSAQMDIDIYSHKEDTAFITENELYNLITTNLKESELEELFKDIDLPTSVGSKPIRWNYIDSKGTEILAKYKLK